MAQYTTTTPAFRLTDAPATGDAFPATDPSASGNRPQAVLLQADTHNIRFTTDGSAPTSSYGMLLVAAAEPTYFAGPLNALRFIQTESGSKLNVTYLTDVFQAAGPQGVTGAQGSVGPQGSQGAQGASGGGGPAGSNDDVQVKSGSGFGSAGAPAAMLAALGVYPPQAATAVAVGALTPVLVTAPGVGVSINDQLYRSSGPVLLGLPPLQDGLTSLTLTNANAIQGDIDLSDGDDSDDLLELQFPVLEIVTGSVVVPSDYASLETLDLSALKVVGGNLALSLTEELDAIDLSALEAVGGTPLAGGFNVNGATAIEALPLDALAFVRGDFSPYALTALTSLSAPLLEYIGGEFIPNQLAAVESLSFPSLQHIGRGLTFNTMDVLASVDLSALQVVGEEINPTGLPMLETLAFPAIVSVGHGIALNDGTDALTTFTLGSTLKSIGAAPGAPSGNVEITSAALTEASVNALLVRLAALDGTNGTTTYDNRTITITGTSAPPSGAGLTAITTLEGRGNTVTVNS